MFLPPERTGELFGATSPRSQLFQTHRRVTIVMVRDRRSHLRMKRTFVLACHAAPGDNHLGLTRPPVQHRAVLLQENLMVGDTLRLDARHVDGDLVIVAIGAVDMASATQLNNVLEHVATLHGVVRLDCAGVTFMDSSGLHVLALAARTCNLSHGEVIIHNPSAPVRRLLQLTRMDAVVTVVVTDSSRLTVD
jgi:anti-sigma B factor antagonist